MCPLRQSVWGTRASLARTVKHDLWGVRAESASTGVLRRHGQAGEGRAL
jgi:hypothetical protein